MSKASFNDSRIINSDSVSLRQAQPSSRHANALSLPLDKLFSAEESL